MMINGMKEENMNEKEKYFTNEKFEFDIEFEYEMIQINNDNIKEFEKSFNNATNPKKKLSEIEIKKKLK
jgi:hypothetical protein